jgi:hypothetical protein
LVPL